MENNEVWADVPGYEGFYRVSNTGRVARCKQLLPCLVLEGKRVHIRELKPIARYAGRLSVALCLPGEKPKWHQIHRLVLMAFVGPCPEGMECRHLDGDHLHNHLDNLKWGTRTENMRDKRIHGTQTEGEQSPRAKLTEDDVRAIRSSKATGRDLAAHYGVSQVAICFIKNRKTWKHVA
jgi:hypothetical protein